jgi:FtsZ-interacting cell division protein ZipA
MTELRKILVVFGVLLALGLLFVGLGRTHLPRAVLQSMRKYASHLPKRQRQRLQIEGKSPNLKESRTDL